MEELGIGRPSTYASILSVLRDRNYVRMENRRFVPEDRGRLVTAFLVSFFERYVDTGFTADLEGKLDDVSAGTLDWRALMRAFWDEFSAAINQTKDLKISDVVSALRRGSGIAFLPAARRWRRSPRVPRLRQRPAWAETGPLRQLHRLQQLPGVPIHAPPGRGRRRRRWRSAERRHAHAGPAPRYRRGRNGAPRPLWPVCAGRANPTPTTRKPSRAARRCPRAWTATRLRWNRRWGC